MPRGAEYDNGVPQSDNPIEVIPGDHKAHGTNPVHPSLSPLSSLPLSLSLLNISNANDEYRDQMSTAHTKPRRYPR